MGVKLTQEQLDSVVQKNTFENKVKDVSTHSSFSKVILRKGPW